MFFDWSLDVNIDECLLEYLGSFDVSPEKYFDLSFDVSFDLFIDLPDLSYNLLFSNAFLTHLLTWQVNPLVEPASLY